jgi:hypothetical protein
VQPSVFCLSLPLNIPQDQNLLMLAVLPFLHGILFSRNSNLVIILLSIVFCNLQFLSQFLVWIFCLYMTFKLISNTAKFCFPLPPLALHLTFPFFLPFFLPFPSFLPCPPLLLPLLPPYLPWLPPFLPCLAVFLLSLPLLPLPGQNPSTKPNIFCAQLVHLSFPVLAAFLPNNSRWRNRNSQNSNAWASFAVPRHHGQLLCTWCPRPPADGVLAVIIAALTPPRLLTSILYPIYKIFLLTSMVPKFFPS